MKISQFFETGERNDGTEFVTLRDDRPDWLYDAVYAAHCGNAPNDWIWRECAAAIEAIEAGDLKEDYLGEYADGRVDVYTKDRMQWVADFCLSSLFSEAEDSAKDMGLEGDMVQQAGVIQYRAIELIAAIMLEFYQNNVEESEES